MNEELQYILGRVRDLYMKFGIRSVTMDDVASELGISKKTLYQYFTDKDDLVSKFIDYDISLRHREICECFKGGYNAIEEFIEIAVFMNRIMKEQNPATEHDLRKYYPHHFQKTVKARREGMARYLLQNIKRGKDQGLYRPVMNEDIIAKLYIFRVESIMLSDMFSVEEFTSMNHFIELLEYHIRGIATEKGIEVLTRKIEQIREKYPS